MFTRAGLFRQDYTTRRAFRLWWKLPDLGSFIEKKILTLSKNGKMSPPPSNDSTDIIVPFMELLFAKLFCFFIFGPDVIRQLFAWMDHLLEEVVLPQTHSPAVLHCNTFIACDCILSCLACLNTSPSSSDSPLQCLILLYFMRKWDHFRSFYKISPRISPNATISSQTTWSFMHRAAYNNAIHFIHVS